MSGCLFISSFYQFRLFSKDGLDALRQELLDAGSQLGLAGQIIIASEGLNGTIAGTPENTAKFKQQLIDLLEKHGTTAPPDPKILFKDSSSKRKPFKKWTVKIRAEVVTSTYGPIDLAASAAGYLSPGDWREKLVNDPNAIVLDTRNNYETVIGAFENAITPNIDAFSEFDNYLMRSDLPRDRPVLIYCTGGIRCEKAGPLMKRHGFKEIYQLYGGILNYLEQYPNDRFRGECFVFDDRVAVDQSLRPTENFQFCPHCGAPASNPIVCRSCSGSARVCTQCLNRPNLRQSCSKTCANLLSSTEEPVLQN